MSKFDEIEFIGHIYSEILFICKVTENVDFDNFYKDEILKRAVTRALEIIGEATKNLDIEFKLKYSNLPWKFMAGMRDKLIHDYMGVDYDLVFNTATVDIPELHFQISEILKDNNNNI